MAIKNSRVILAGVDEVGRGPLAGDVVAAAVVLGNKHGIEGLNDSKKLSDKKRKFLFEQIKDKSLSWSIARASAQEIDEINILQASLLAMKRAVEGLSLKPTFVQVDGNKLPIWEYEAEAVVQGDGLIAEISAASILAKVTRDEEMQHLDERYPGYGFFKHKGYPTKAHMLALAKLGPSEIHRRSFAPVRAAIQDAAKAGLVSSGSKQKNKTTKKAKPVPAARSTPQGELF